MENTLAPVFSARKYTKLFHIPSYLDSCKEEEQSLLLEIMSKINCYEVPFVHVY